MCAIEMSNPKAGVGQILKLYLEYFSSYVHFSKLKRKTQTWVYLFVLRFYSPVNPMGSCQARSVYLTTHLLGRLCPLSS